MSELISKLSQAETRRLTELEGIVRRGLASFIEVGAALREIRDSRLYRVGHDNFEDYCRQIWNMSRQNAYYLMDSGEIAEDLIRSGVRIPPTCERQVRPLKKLHPSQRAHVWELACDVQKSGTRKPVVKPSAIQLAEQAISVLVKIHPSDPERIAALQMVARFIATSQP